MTIASDPVRSALDGPATLNGPGVHEPFNDALDELVSAAREGHRPSSEFYNPSDEWLIERMRVLQDMSPQEQAPLLREYEQIQQENEAGSAQGKVASRAGPDTAIRTDAGGLAFYSQLGVARRPDLTQYFIDGFTANRDAVVFSYESQQLFADVLPYITRKLREAFERGDTVVQTDRRIADAPGRSYHARQTLYGTKYLQLPYMWRQLTFELPEAERRESPQILEISLPRWLEDAGLPERLIDQVKAAGLERLVFKAPTKGLSLHLGFDYVGEHKMGPLSIAMFLTKQKNGLAVQAALSVARITTVDGKANTTALVTVGPSLHGKSTLTIMIDPAQSDLADRLSVARQAGEGVYPMNDDIVLLQPLPEVLETKRDGVTRRLPYSIDGTENNFYAVPFGLTREDDPITYDVLCGTDGEPNPSQSLENVVVDPKTGAPNFMINPTRNMRAIFSRSRLLERKGVDGLLSTITGGRMREAVHVPLEETDRVFWQAVMRQNTVIPPLQRLNSEQYVRALMFGEAVQMGAATGAIGKPYVEYFSDPFIIGLEDENANLLYQVLREMERGRMRQEYYAFNTGGIGADTNEEASGPRYKKIARDLTLLLQEALLRGAVVFEYDSILGTEIAVAVVNSDGHEIVSLREEWLPRSVYGDEEYGRRIDALRRRRFFGRDSEDKAGILRYTKVIDAVIDIKDVPVPANERELSWLLSFCWHVDRAYDTLAEVVGHRHEGMKPAEHMLRVLRKTCELAQRAGLGLAAQDLRDLTALGVVTEGKPPAAAVSSRLEKEIRSL